MIEIRKLDKSMESDLRLKNEPFSMPGRFIPALRDGVWSYRTELFAQPGEMVFPDEDYDFDELEKDSVMLGAYDGEACVGLAIYQRPFFRYMYLYDLKVASTYRGKGVGRALIEAGKKLAREMGYQGIYTQAQDNNLNACLFYLKMGFAIGGFDNRLYDGTRQAGKADVVFYLEA